MNEQRYLGAWTDDLLTLRERFTTAQPFGHVVIDDFFAPDFLAQLVAQFPPFEDRYAMNENKEIGGKATRERLAELGTAYEQLDKIVASASFRDQISTVTAVPKLQFDPDYIGGGTHDNRHGQDLDPHIDFNYHPINGQHRRLNLIVYFNDNWQQEWGGALDLHLDPRNAERDEHVRVPPIANRAVVFETTETSWHGFERINLPAELRSAVSRRSFALYYYTKERPEEQTADPHSTVYVERHLPDHLVAGYTLAEADVQQIQGLLRRRDLHLKRLYGEIQSLSAQLRDARQYGRATPAIRLVRAIKRRLFS